MSEPVPVATPCRRLARLGIGVTALLVSALSVAPAAAAGADVDFIGTLIYGALGSLVPVPGVEELWRGRQPTQTRLLLSWPVQVACLQGDFLSPDCRRRLVATPELVVTNDVLVRGRFGYRWTPGGSFLGLGTSADVRMGPAASPELGSPTSLRAPSSQSSDFIPTAGPPA